MAQSSKIEWTDATWNVISGCSPLSEGCQNCYAQRMARRLAGRCGYPPYPDHFKVTLHPDRLEDPLRWRKPRMVFVCSMSDLFHESIHWSVVEAVFMTMVKARQHVFQVLTKRADRMLEFVSECFPGLDRCSPHIWLGVTAENQKRADERIPLLLQTPAAVHFVSCEPLLGPVDFKWRTDGKPCSHLGCLSHTSHACEGCGRIGGRVGIDWLITGGEAGPGARPSHPDWFRSLRDQCLAAGVPYFHKQNGEWLAHPEWVAAGRPQYTNWGCLSRSGNWFPLTTTWNGRQGDERDDFEYSMYRVGKKRAGRLLDGREWNEMPEVTRR
jgi:protein gp37